MPLSLASRGSGEPLPGLDISARRELEHPVGLGFRVLGLGLGFRVPGEGFRVDPDLEIQGTFNPILRVSITHL